MKSKTSDFKLKKLIFTLIFSLTLPSDAEQQNSVGTELQWPVFLIKAFQKPKP